MKQKILAPLSEKRLAELPALGKQAESPEVPDPIIEKQKAEIAKLQSELSAEVFL